MQRLSILRGVIVAAHFVAVLGCAAWAGAPAAASPALATRGQPSAAVSSNVLEVAPTAFLPDLDIDDIVLFQGTPVRWFTSEKNRYTGWYAGFSGGRRIGYRASVGIGKQTFFLFAEGPVVSLDALDLETTWFYAAGGPALHLSRGPVAVSPSLGLGGALIAASMTATGVSGSDDANGTTMFLSYEFPLRVWIGRRFGLSAGYQGFLPLSEPSFGFSKGAVRLDGRSGHGYEVRLGVCTR